MAVVQPTTILVRRVNNANGVTRGVLSSVQSVGVSLPPPRPLIPNITLRSTSPIPIIDLANYEVVDDESPRKRRRLTNMTPEAKMMRRKLKNRVAAQTARDRKKLKMDELQEIVTNLQAENKRLRSENSNLTKQANELWKENSNLKNGLDRTTSAGVCRESNESAEGIDSRCTSAEVCVSSVVPYTESDMLPSLYEEFSEDTFKTEPVTDEEDIEYETSPEQVVQTTKSVLGTVVGATAEDMESIKELILFDHVYNKPPEITEQQYSDNNDEQTIGVQGVLAADIDAMDVVVKGEVEGVFADIDVMDVVVKGEIEEDEEKIESTLELPEGFQFADMLDTESIIDLDNLLKTLETATQEPLELSAPPVVVPTEMDALADVYSISSKDCHVASSTSKASNGTRQSSVLPDSIVELYGIGSNTPQSSFFDDSDYSSDVSSPLSTASTSLEDDSGIWEDSFSELFPSLM